MADKELEALLADKEPETPPASGDTKVEPEEDQEVLKRREQLDNLNKAIAQANKELKDLRKPKKEEEEELPKIDLEDPNAKAWDKHIRENVNPLAEENEKAKEEVRNFALRQFLTTHPDLANDSEKLSQVMATYNRIKTATERTPEGVLVDLSKAYAAENFESLEETAQVIRQRKAEGDLLFSEPAITRGATTYSSDKETLPQLSADDRKQIEKMYPGGVKEWIDLKKKYSV